MSRPSFRLHAGKRHTALPRSFGMFTIVAALKQPDKSGDGAANTPHFDTQSRQNPRRDGRMHHPNPGIAHQQVAAGWQDAPDPLQDLQ